MVGGDTFVGFVDLEGPAPAAGIIATLSDNLPSTTMPASVKILAGETQASFTITTKTVRAIENGTVTASNGSSSQGAPLAVRPIGVKSVSISPTPVVGGQNATGTVVLERPAPSAMIVYLTDNIPSTSFPASVTVPVGADTATFPVKTKVVTANQSGTLTAKVNGTQKTVAYTVKTASGPLCTTMSFGPFINVQSNSAPSHFVAEDFNGDGYQDLAVAQGYSLRVSVQYGDGSGNFGTAKYYQTGGVGESHHLAVGDFNKDGKPDLAVADYSYQGDVAILLNNGGGGLSSTYRYPAAYANSITVGDFNNDGKQDLAVTHYNSDDVTVLMGNGTGRFGAPVGFNAGQNPEQIAVADFNGDGKQDLAVANANSTFISILSGNGAGGFSQPVNIPVGYNSRRIIAGDFNKDGKQDLAVSGLSAASMTVLIGKGTGSFTLTKRNLASVANDLAVADVNGDGKDDLAVANSNSFNIAVFSGDGTGRFGTAANYNTAATPTRIVFKDFNRDTKLDLATTLWNNYYTVVAQLNTCQ